MTTTITTTYDFFWKPENNRVHPSTLASKSFSVELPEGLAPWDAITQGREVAPLRLPLGSARTGIHEIQNDEGVWTRTSTNRRENSTWEFTSWDDLDAAELASA